MGIEYDKRRKKYRARIGSGPYRRSSPYFVRKKDAQAWEAEIRAQEIRHQSSISVPEMPVEEALDEFILSLKRTTFRHQKDVRRCLVEFFTEFNIRSIGEIHARYAERLKSRSHLGLHALRRKLTHIKSFARYLDEVSYLEKNPLLYVKKPTGRTNEKRALEDYEVTELLEAVKRHAPSIYEPIFFIAHTGLRKSECLTLEWDTNIDFNRNVVVIKDKPHILVDNEPFRCKWGSQRVVPLVDSVLEQLERLKRTRTTNWVFPNQNGGMLKSNINRAFINARSKSKLERPEEITPHTLRHTWISQLLSRGVDLKSVSVMAGHRNLTTTEKYAHLLGGVEKMHLDILKLPKF